MVHQDTEPAAGAGPESSDRAGEVVNAVQGLDDDALHPEIVTPDLFDEFGVVLAFHPDPAGLSHLGALARDADGAGGCARARGARGGPGRRRHQPDRLSLQQEAEPEAEGP